MMKQNIFKFTAAIIGFIAALTCMNRYVQADTADETSVAIFLDEAGTVKEYYSYTDGSEIVPPTGAVSFGWAEDTYQGRTGYYVVPPSVTAPQSDKVYTGIMLNNMFVPVKVTDLRSFLEGTMEAHTIIRGFQNLHLLWIGMECLST